MLLTEKEAIEKYCPHSNQPECPWSVCMASKCMAWRWEQIATPEYIRLTDKGYCGIAGRPE